MQELRLCLREAKNTAPGHDEVYYIMLKKLPEKGLQFLLHLFNTVWLSEVFPSDWREAIVIMFNKPGKEPTLPCNFRPIALTCVMCKLLEKVINARLMHELEINRHLSPNQYGFRKLRSCPDSLARLETDILEAFAGKQHLIAVFFDIAKAYDTTWRHLILKKLHSLGYRGRLAIFIKNFLSGRIFRIRVGKCYSNVYRQQQGVPQGSVMSCTLFALAINDVVENIPPGVCKSLYVDDLAIYYSSRNLNSIERQLQLAINNIHKWTCRNGFQISTEKTVAVHFHNKKGLQHEITLTMAGRNILFRDDAKFLGLRFDTKLTWEPHIRELRAKCIQSLSLLKCLCNMNWGSDRQTLLRLYRATTRSKLDYGSQIYSSAKERRLNLLNSVHHSALRQCTGAFRSSPIVSLLVDAGEPSLQLRRTKLSLQHYVRLHALPDSVVSRTIFDISSRHLFVNNTSRIPFSMRNENLVQQYNMQPLLILPCYQQEEPRWRLPDVICPGLLDIRKAEHSAPRLAAIFRRHIDHCHGQAYHVYTDGSCTERGTGSGVYSATLEKSIKLSPVASSFTAEMYGILEALDLISNRASPTNVIFTDSRSAISSMGKIKDTHPILVKIQNLLIKLSYRGINVKFCWVPAHVGLAGNEHADRLAREAAQSNTEICHPAVPHRDYYPHIRKTIFDRWQQEWANTNPVNKLRSFRNNIDIWPSSNQRVRRNEVILTRLRLGHTRLTHGHLMRGEPIPAYCMNCLVPLTVSHFLVECPDYSVERYRAFGPNATMKNILGDPLYGGNINNLLMYLTQTNILNQI